MARSVRIRVRITAETLAPVGSYRPKPWLVASAGAGAVLFVVVLAASAMGGGDTQHPPIPTPVSAANSPRSNTSTSTPARSPSATAIPSNTPVPVTPTPDASVLHDQSVVTGQINSPDERDRFVFDGKQGDLIDVRATRDPTGAARVQLHLDGPVNTDGQDASPNDDYTLLRAVLKSTGRYTLTASSNGVGAYKIRFLLNPYQDVSSSLQVVASAIQESDDVQRYRFQGTRGQFLYVRVDRDPTASVAPHLYLDNPSGQQVQEASNNAGHSIISYRLVDTGPFVLRVASERRGTGTYKLRLLLDGYLDVSSAQSLDGAITLPDDEVFYRFEGVAGRTIVVTMTRTTTGSVAPHLRLFNPFNSQRAEASESSGKATLKYKLEDTGTFIVAARSDRGGLGGYTISFSTQ